MWTRSPRFRDEGLEPWIVLEIAPPPVRSAAEPLLVSGVGREVIPDEIDRDVVVAENHTHGGLVDWQLALRIDLGRRRPCPLQHPAGAVGERGARQRAREDRKSVV